IGTMKCLGALDSFILKLFLIESLLLGAAGTLCGVALGLGLNFLMLLKHYGSTGVAALPWSRLLPVAAGSFAIGVSITLAAALYPAWKAARMEPIAALRMEV
ncbi:MAG: FtsX-like permease family protein, partial [Phycisphaerae bacterium]